MSKGGIVSFSNRNASESARGYILLLCSLLNHDTITISSQGIAYNGDGQDRGTGYRGVRAVASVQTTRRDLQRGRATETPAPIPDLGPGRLLGRPSRPALDRDRARARRPPTKRSTASEAAGAAQRWSVRALDATYCFDLLRGDAGARDRAVEWENHQELLSIPAPALTEFLRSGYRRGGRLLERSLTLTRRLEVLPLEGDTAEDAARLGGDLDRRGLSVGNLDLLIAAVTRKYHAILVTRDQDFQRIPGLHLETY